MATSSLGVAEPDARYLVQSLPRGTLVDSCILIDVLADDAQWADWSLDQLEHCAALGPLVINPLILAELSPRFERANDLEAAKQQMKADAEKSLRHRIRENTAEDEEDEGDDEDFEYVL